MVKITFEGIEIFHKLLAKEVQSEMGLNSIGITSLTFSKLTLFNYPQLNHLTFSHHIWLASFLLWARLCTHSDTRSYIWLKSPVIVAAITSSIEKHTFVLIFIIPSTQSLIHFAISVQSWHVGFQSGGNDALFLLDHHSIMLSLQKSKHFLQPQQPHLHARLSMGCLPIWILMWFLSNYYLMKDLGICSSSTSLFHNILNLSIC